MAWHRYLRHRFVGGWVIVVAVSVAAQEGIRRGVPGSFSWLPIAGLLGAIFYAIWLTCPGSSFWRSLRRLGIFGVTWWLATYGIGRALALIWPYQGLR
ncbi:MAG: hypothetical protein WDA75_16510 [Candidatus Latescibacterota bacterium]|jgi:hypothetical protein